MQESYEVMICLKYGDTEQIISRNFETIAEAYRFCKKNIPYFGVDCRSCAIFNGWMDTIYDYTMAGEHFFVEFKEMIHEVSEKTFKTVYDVK